MNWRAMFFRTTARAVLRRAILTGVAGAALVAAGCGGSGYGGGSSAPPPAAATKSTVTMGAITAFSTGGVNLNGMQFQAGGAAVSIDGANGQLASLHVGDVVQVRGHHDDGGGDDVADEIDFRGNVEGPVSAIDTTAQTLVVLGQTVAVSADTSFDDDISPASLAGVHVGDIVEVSGLPGADGTIHATRIEGKPPGSTFQVVGTVSNTDATAKTLNINALAVDFATATLKDFAAGGPQDGDLVEAHGTAIEANGALQATSLERLNGADLRDDQDDAARVEGLITRFASASDFDVSGHPVATSASTEFEGGTAADLALNVHVEVEGTVDASGVIQAQKVHIEAAADVRLTAQVDAVDASAGTVSMLGIQISVDDMTRFDGHGSQQSGSFGLADVHVGDWLEIRGSESGSGNAVTATRLDREQPQSEVRLMGPVSAVAPPDFTLVATTVATTGTTDFSNGLNAAAFFDTATGKSASVRGSWDGTVLAATKVQLGDDHDDND